MIVALPGLFSYFFMLFLIVEVLTSDKLPVIVGSVGVGSVVIILAVVGFQLVRLVRRRRYSFYCVTAYV